MIVGRSPRNPVIGDTVLLRAENRQGIGTIVDSDAIRYKVYWRNARPLKTGGRLRCFLARSSGAPQSSSRSSA
jgi:hypothetical protein